MRKLYKISIYLLLILTGLFASFLLFITANDYRPKNIDKAIINAKGEVLPVNDSIFTFLTWNLGYFGLGSESDFFYDGGKMTRPQEKYYRHCAGKALDYLAESDKADFYFFQEIDINSRRSYGDDQVALLNLIFPDYFAVSAINYQVPFVPVPLGNPLGKVKSGLACYFKFNTEENTRYAFPVGFSWPLSLFMLDRCFILSRLKLPSGLDLVMINTHNEAFDDGSHREAQLFMLRETMMQEHAKGNFVVAGGDWNINPAGYDVVIFPSGDIAKEISPKIASGYFPENWQWVYAPDVPTNRNVDQTYVKGITPTTIIDYFVVSPNVTVLMIETEDLGFECSDHHPVKMKIKL